MGVALLNASKSNFCFNISNHDLDFSKIEAANPTNYVKKSS